MSRRNSFAFALLAGGVLWAQSPELPLDPRTAFKVTLGADAPLTLMSSDWGQSKAVARGGALQLDLHATLLVRNATARRVRGVSLLVLAQEVTPGGRASVTVPSLDVPPGETVPLRVDLRLMRPLLRAGGPLVELSLDGVLFDDLGFYGPDKLNARRSMLAWELEARRDRRYLAALLDKAGPEGVRREMLAGLDRLATQPTLEMQVARAGRATSAEAVRTVNLAFLQLPGAPVALTGGAAQVAGNEARAPRLDIENRAGRPIRHIEVGWILRDTAGREYQAGAIPAGVDLAPGARTQVTREGALRFARPGGAPLAIAGMTGYLSTVEFADGSVWVPSRAALDNSALSRVRALSPEEQRLVELYRRKGLDAVVAELRRLR